MCDNKKIYYTDKSLINKLSDKHYISPLWQSESVNEVITRYLLITNYLEPGILKLNKNRKVAISYENNEIIIDMNQEYDYDENDTDEIHSNFLHYLEENNIKYDVTTDLDTIYPDSGYIGSGKYEPYVSYFEERNKYI